MAGDIYVNKTSYGVTIDDTSVSEGVAVEFDDIPQLIQDLTAALPDGAVPRFKVCPVCAVTLTNAKCENERCDVQWVHVFMRKKES